jgi:hypothetical protein
VLYGSRVCMLGGEMKFTHIISVLMKPTLSRGF